MIHTLYNKLKERPKLFKSIIAAGGVLAIVLIACGIYASIPSVSQIAIDGESMVMDINQDGTVSYKLFPEGCRSGELEFVSENSDVLRFSSSEDQSSGVLASTGLEGTAQIYIRDKKYDVISNKVLIKVEDVQLIQQMKDTAKPIQTKITELSTPYVLHLADKETISFLRSSYQKLPLRAQQYVQEAQLTRLEEAMTTLESRLSAEGKAVSDQITAIGEVSLDKAEAIQTARSAYEKLSSDAKTFVSNTDVLGEAEQKLEAIPLIQAAEQKIAEIGEVTLDSENAISEAKTAYAAVPADYQSLVSNKDTLGKASQELTTQRKAEAARQKEQAELEKQWNTPPLTDEGSGYAVVFWTPNGKSYHSTSGCRTLKRSKTIRSGSVSEARSSGHGDPCNVCT